MGLRIYEDAALTQLVTLEDVFTNPDDEDDVDGDAGETKQKALYAAIEQTTLNGDINDSVTTIPLAAARFSDTNLNVIVIGTEKMWISTGHGTTSLTVSRGYAGTTPATHSDGDPVYLCYDVQSDAAITCEDNEQVISGDESGWVKFCADAAGSPEGTWVLSFTIGALDYNQSLKFWRQVIVPASTNPQMKQDLLLTVTATLEEHVI